MKQNGFYICLLSKDCFLVSNAKTRTKKLAEEFLQKLEQKTGQNIRIDDYTIELVRKTMIPATMELKTIENGNFAGLQYIDINGDGFCFGCDPCENPYEKVIVC